MGKRELYIPIRDEKRSFRRWLLLVAMVYSAIDQETPKKKKLRRRERRRTRASAPIGRRGGSGAGVARVLSDAIKS